MRQHGKWLRVARPDTVNIRVDSLRDSMARRRIVTQ